MKIILFILLILTNYISAQEHLHLKYKHDISLSYHYGNFFNYSNITSVNDRDLCCEKIQKGNSILRNTMLNWRYSPFFYSQFIFSFGYFNSESYYSEYENEDINVKGNLYPGIFAHNLILNNKKTMLAAGYEYNAWKKLFIGSQIILFFDNIENYRYKEEIIIPSDKGVFKETGTRTRNIMSGSSEFSVNAGFSVNLYYLFALNSSHSLYFSPEIKLSAGQDMIMNKFSENYFGYSFGINIHKKLSIREIFKN